MSQQYEGNDNTYDFKGVLLFLKSHLYEGNDNLPHMINIIVIRITFYCDATQTIDFLMDHFHTVVFTHTHKTSGPWPNVFEQL